MNDLISVIVPVYKVQEYLNRCVESIAAQTYDNLEIILVDDGSPDECPGICDAWAKKDRRIKVIHKSNGGLSDARNAGLDECSGDYIAFVDSDDWIDSDMYETMLHGIKAENADICACNIRNYNEFDGTSSEWGSDKYIAGESDRFLKMLYDDTKFSVSACNKLFRRNLWKELRYPVGKICEDAFTTCQLIHKAKSIVQIKAALYNYRIRPESIMTSFFSRERMDEEEAWHFNCDFIKKNYPELYNNAYTFYIQKVRILIHDIQDSQREEFAAEYAYLRRILKENMRFMMSKSTASLKYKASYLTDVIRL